MKTSQGICINLMNKEFQVNCPPGQEAELQEAVEYLERNMKEIRASGKITGAERIAIMAALNITHDMLTLQKQERDYKSFVQERVGNLQGKLEFGLAKLNANQETHIENLSS